MDNLFTVENKIENTIIRNINLSIFYMQNMNDVLRWQIRILKMVIFVNKLEFLGFEMLTMSFR